MWFQNQFEYQLTEEKKKALLNLSIQTENNRYNMTLAKK